MVWYGAEASRERYQLCVVLVTCPKFKRKRYVVNSPNGCHNFPRRGDRKCVKPAAQTPFPPGLTCSRHGNEMGTSPPKSAGEVARGRSLMNRGRGKEEEVEEGENEGLTVCYDYYKGNAERNVSGMRILLLPHLPPNKLNTGA
ncbi:hypothetical protein TNCV_302101 [Trichonephila clavipes]|nr:hypothetical protein TNCV_302101 [Trichonephila clavipes]